MDLKKHLHLRVMFVLLCLVVLRVISKVIVGLKNVIDVEASGIPNIAGGCGCNTEKGASSVRKNDCYKY